VSDRFKRSFQDYLLWIFLILSFDISIKSLKYQLSWGSITEIKLCRYLIKRIEQRESRKTDVGAHAGRSAPLIGVNEFPIYGFPGTRVRKWIRAINNIYWIELRTILATTIYRIYKSSFVEHLFAVPWDSLFWTTTILKIRLVPVLNMN